MMVYRLWSVKNRIVTADGDGKIVIFNYKTNQRAVMPPPLTTLLHQFQSREKDAPNREYVVERAKYLMENNPLS